MLPRTGERRPKGVIQQRGDLRPALLNGLLDDGFAEVRSEAETGHNESRDKFRPEQPRDTESFQHPHYPSVELGSAAIEAVRLRSRPRRHHVGVDQLAGMVPRARHEMAVARERLLDGPVAHELLNRLGVDASVDQQRGEGVAACFVASTPPCWSLATPALRCRRNRGKSSPSTASKAARAASTRSSGR